MKKNKILVGILCSFLSNNIYSEEGTTYMNKYQKEEYNEMSTTKKVLYGGGLAGAIVGIVVAADNINSDSSGTEIEIGDPPPEETPTTFGVKKNTNLNKDIARTLLVARDISGMYRDKSLLNMKKAEESLDIYVEGIEGKGEYTGVIGGLYAMKSLWKKDNLNLRGSMGYSHMETDYETNGDGRSDTIHLGLYLEYTKERISNYSWLANEFSYNKYDDRGSDNYKTNYLRAGNEISYELGRSNLSIRPYMSVEGGYLSMDEINSGDTKISSEDYTSFRWGPGLEIAKKYQEIQGLLRAAYVREEGDIYDELTVIDGGIPIKIKDMEGSDSFEITLEASYKLKAGDIYARGKYILRDESNSVIGSFGIELNI